MAQEFDNKEAGSNTGEGEGSSVDKPLENSPKPLESLAIGGVQNGLKFPFTRKEDGPESGSKALSDLKLKKPGVWREFPLKMVFPLHRLDFKQIAPFSSFREINKRDPHKKVPREVAEKAMAVADELFAELESGSRIIAEPISDPFQSLNKNMLARLVFAESTGEVAKESLEGAKGLGQVVDATGEGMVKKYMVAESWEPFNPRMNLRATALFMAELLQTYRGDNRVALAAYNHGPTKVNRLLKELTFGSYSELERLLPNGYSTADKTGEYRPYDDTTEYVRKVITGPQGEPKVFKLRMF